MIALPWIEGTWKPKSIRLYGKMNNQIDVCTAATATVTAIEISIETV
jgi:hypothetical protein